MLNTPYRDGVAIPLSVASNTTILEGELVAVSATGQAVPAHKSGAKYIIGRAEAEVTAEAGDTTKVVTVTRNRQFMLNNDASNPVTAADIGSIVVLKSQNTVAKPKVGSTAKALPVGALMGVDYNGKVWVEVSGAPLAEVNILAW
jgi:hypothetical protein